MPPVRLMKPAGKRRGRTRHGTGRSAGRRGWIFLGMLATALLVLVGVVLLPGRGAGNALAVLETADFHSLAFSPTSPDVVFFGHHNGVLRSEDGGRAWRPLVAQRNFDAMGLAVSGAQGGTIYLAGHNIFLVSPDGGRAWQPVSHDLPGTDIHGFAMSPSDPKRLFAFVVGFGIFGSTDEGHRWALLNDQLPGDIMALTAAGGDPEVLYAGSMRLGALRSADGGRTWTGISSGLPSSGVFALAVDPTTRAVYAGVDGGLYKSTDRGRTWERLSYPGSNAVAVAVSPLRPKTVLAITVKSGRGLVYRSEDGGRTWGSR